MDEIIHSTSGPTGATGRAPLAKLRLVGLVLTALLGSVLVIWTSHKTWQRVEGLQREFAGLKADNFYLGVHVRGEIHRLNDTLLRYRLQGDTNDAAIFSASAHDFKLWLDQTITKTNGSDERRFLRQVATAYDSYLTDSVPVLTAGRGWLQSTQAKEFKNSYEKVQNQSRRLLDLCDSFINNQRASFGDLIEYSNDTLTTFMQLLRLLLVLLLTLAAALVILVYRGMIAPLRHQLTETNAIILRQEKLAALGVLAAGVAHEIRNPLTAIKFRLYSLKKNLPGAASDNEDAAVIGNEINRLERIVRDFLQFARPSDPALAVIPAQRILVEVQELLQAQLNKSAIELKLEPSASAWVRADRQQIKQVLINLVQNSADSIEHGGIITLRVRSGSGSGRYGGGDTVILDVADNGKGIPPEVQKRLFDPFFTTKESGTGLGLPIAASIVEKHGGELRYQTELRCGTTFSVVLPGVQEHET
jgi:signal transduction histidine kinase